MQKAIPIPAAMTNPIAANSSVVQGTKAGPSNWYFKHLQIAYPITPNIELEMNKYVGEPEEQKREPESMKIRRN